MITWALKRTKVVILLAVSLSLLVMLFSFSFGRLYQSKKDKIGQESQLFKENLRPTPTMTSQLGWTKEIANEKCRSAVEDKSIEEILPPNLETGAFSLIADWSFQSPYSPDCSYKLINIGFFAEQGEYKVKPETVAGIWLINLNTKSLRKIVESRYFSEFMGWIDNDTFVFKGQEPETENEGTFTFNIETNKLSSFYPID